ncbi:MAG: hypothetical protein JEZ09_02510 [Salinivirgaceae bacterium]|nr:hypothetical protein [Salinivirgaceae bacterium]
MIYTFRFISDEQDSFVLDVNINHDQTFEQMQDTIQEALDYDPSHMASFFVSNNEWEKLEEITIMDMGADIPVKNMSETLIQDCFFEKNQRILYVFDFFAERIFFGSVIRMIDAEPPIDLPTVSLLQGKIPAQLIANQNLDVDFLNSIDYSDELDSEGDDMMDYIDDMESFDESDY